MKTIRSHSQPEPRVSMLLKDSRVRGFTLVEVMVAIMVIGLALTSSTICLRIGMLQHDTARATTFVTQVLQDEAETIRLLNWTALENLSGSVTFQPSSTLDYEEINLERFTFKREISNSNGESGLKQILLTAEWTGIRSDKHRLALFFDYAQNGMHDYYYGIQ
ncbi:type IV pilus modification PilV family protein [Coraliomargarita sp. W4R53]